MPTAEQNRLETAAYTIFRTDPCRRRRAGAGLWRTVSTPRFLRPRSGAYSRQFKRILLRPVLLGRRLFQEEMSVEFVFGQWWVRVAARHHPLPQHPGLLPQLPVVEGYLEYVRVVSLTPESAHDGARSAR